MTKEEFDNLQPGDYVKTTYGYWGYVTMIDRTKDYYLVKGDDREELQFWHQGKLAAPDEVPKNSDIKLHSRMGYLSGEDSWSEQTYY